MRRLAACLVAAPLLAGCGLGAFPTQGSSTLTIDVVNLFDAEGGRLRGELVQSVEPQHLAPAWPVLRRAIDSSPYSTSQTLKRMPDGEFTLTVATEPPKAEGTDMAPEGVGCEMTFQMAAQEQVSITIDGLKPLVDSGYGPCNGSIDRTPIAP